MSEMLRMMPTFEDAAETARVRRMTGAVGPPTDRDRQTAAVMEIEGIEPGLDSRNTLRAPRDIYLPPAVPTGRVRVGDYLEGSDE